MLLWENVQHKWKEYLTTQAGRPSTLVQGTDQKLHELSLCRDTEQAIRGNLHIKQTSAKGRLNEMMKTEMLKATNCLHIYQDLNTLPWRPFPE